jgi:hypothetical protein
MQSVDTAPFLVSCLFGYAPAPFYFLASHRRCTILRDCRSLRPPVKD